MRSLRLVAILKIHPPILGQTLSPGLKAPTAPPWLSFGADCQLVHSSATSGNSWRKLDEHDNPTRFLPMNQSTCSLQVKICDDTFFRTRVIDGAAGQTCPPELDPSYAPPSSICCAAWEAAMLSKTPCAPLEGADCDGRLNALDSYPLDPVR